MSVLVHYNWTMRFAEVFLRMGTALVAWMMLLTHFVWLAVLHVIGCGPDGDEMHRLLFGLAPFTILFDDATTPSFVGTTNADGATDINGGSVTTVSEPGWNAAAAFSRSSSSTMLKLSTGVSFSSST